MSADWQGLTRHAGLRFEGNTIVVSFLDQRSQTVNAESSGEDTLRLWSVVAKRAMLHGLKTPLIDAWYRNRLSELVGFTLDTQGRMIGETWVPVAGITADEWGYLVRNLARACDRYEYLLTGRDES